MILVNYKTYPEVTGEKARAFTTLVASMPQSVEWVVCPQAMDLAEVAEIHPNTWAQHIDPDPQGRGTGFITAEEAKQAGAVGTILNHSEHKLSFEVLEKTVARAKEVGLKVLIFAADVAEAQKVASLHPDWVGYEPPELIASKDTSVAKAKPEVIASVVAAVPAIPILVGAGVKDQDDVRVSLKLGAKGVGLASGVILAPDQKAVLDDLFHGFS